MDGSRRVSLKGNQKMRACSGRDSTSMSSLNGTLLCFLSCPVEFLPFTVDKQIMHPKMMDAKYCFFILGNDILSLEMVELKAM